MGVEIAMLISLPISSPSRPARALGVEIRCNIETIVGSWSRPARALGVEISVLLATIWTPIQSRPARALGVEIPSTFLITRLQIVEAREGLGG